RRSSAPGTKFCTSTSDWAITLRNRSLPASVLRLSVRLRLLAFKIRKNRLSLFFWSRRFTRAMSPPLGSSSLITSAPRKPRICVQAGPAWLCVMSMMRTPDNALSMAALLLPAAVHASRKAADDHPYTARPHPEEARRAVSKGSYTACVAILRDAALRAAPQDEVICESLFNESEY